MRNIKELYKKHDGQNVTLFANGPSLFKFLDIVKRNPMYFDKKLLESIFCGINYSFEHVGINKLTYVFIQELETYKSTREIVPSEKLIIPENPGLNLHGTAERVKVNNPKAYGYDLQNPLRNKKWDLVTKFCGIKKKMEFFSYTTTFQPVIHILCYMGFRHIYTVGVDYKVQKSGKVHYESKYNPKYGNQKWQALARFKEGDDYLIPQLQKLNNVNIINIGQTLL